MSLCRVYKKSKCLRAFDRRPAPRRVTNDQEFNKDSTICNHNNVQIFATSSPDSSSSLDHGQTSNEVGEGSQMDINVDHREPLLYWEHVDWFLGIEP